MIRILAAALFLLFGQVAFAQDPDEVSEEDVKKLKELHSSQFRNSSDVKLICGDNLVGLWATDKSDIKDAAVLRRTDNANNESGIYRVCNWGSTTRARIAPSKDNKDESFELHPFSCADFKDPVHIGLASTNGNALVFGFYCKIE